MGINALCTSTSTRPPAPVRLRPIIASGHRRFAVTSARIRHGPHHQLRSRPRTTSSACSGTGPVVDDNPKTPAPPRTSAVAAPIPRLAPVITATRSIGRYLRLLSTARVALAENVTVALPDRDGGDDSRTSSSAELP